MRNLLNTFLMGSRRKERLQVIKEFDRDFYLSEYPDVRQNGMDPLKHYQLYGWREGRNPSQNFITKKYLEMYSLSESSKIDPLTHSVRHGRGGNQRDLAKTSLGYSTESEAYPYFDREFYLRNNDDIRRAGIDPYRHFMEHGWKEHRVPSELFSTKFYLENYPDIQGAQINPLDHFIRHGKAEGRASLPYSEALRYRSSTHSVTIIIPNFNHERYLRRRIDSILCQTYKNFNIIILDDSSSDGSRDVITEYASRYPDKIRFIFNDRNSGSVFSQWQRGVSEAVGDIIWICESDDYCAEDFLENAIRAFVDESVMLAFGRIQFANEKGEMIEGLDAYREQSMPGGWNENFVLPAAELFRGAFGNTNIIPNVGGCLFRKQRITETEWSFVKSFKILGDWCLYLILARGGKIAYIRDAVSFFRQHDRNTSVESFKEESYYREHAKINKTLRYYWGGDVKNSFHLFKRCVEQYKIFTDEALLSTFSRLYNLHDVVSIKRKKRHILICILGFELGGGEIFPIHLANELAETGFIVSVAVLRDTGGIPAVRNSLDSRIAVYHVNDIVELGFSRFLEAAGVDLVHSHYIGAEYAFLKDGGGNSNCPYIVTLHGSYESAAISSEFLLILLRKVSHWVYLTRRNLNHLEGLPLTARIMSRIPNGMPVRNSADLCRADLNIEEDAFVFAVASRAIDEKGWRETIAAFRAIKLGSSSKIHLILCGIGPIYDELKFEQLESCIHLMGFCSDVDSIYSLSDVAVLATRFGGESYPLTLIQALQASKPIISTDVGEIRSMMTCEGRLAGLIIEPSEDNEEFCNSLQDAMVNIMQRRHYNYYAEVARSLANSYNIKAIAAKYVELYLGEWLDDGLN